MADDGLAAAEIARQIAALKPRVQGSRGVMGYMDKPKGDKRADVNKLFLASTILGVDSHNRRQEEEKCWTLRRMDQKLEEARDRHRSSLRSSDHKIDEKKRHRSSRRCRSRSRSRSSHCRRSRSRNRRTLSRARSRRSSSRNGPSQKNEQSERAYWAKKKADKTRKLWENLHLEGTVSVESDPDFSDEFNDDIKPHKSKSLSRPNCKEHTKGKKNDKK